MLNKIKIIFIKYVIFYLIILAILFVFEKPAPAFYMGADVRFFFILFLFIGGPAMLIIFIIHSLALLVLNKINKTSEQKLSLFEDAEKDK
jgi:hypothetical protein